jgi:hypothetical protein
MCCGMTSLHCSNVIWTLPTSSHHQLSVFLSDSLFMYVGSSFFFCLFIYIFGSPRVGTQGLYFLGRWPITWAMPPALTFLCFSYFLDNVLCFLSKENLNHSSPNLHLPGSWNYQPLPPCIAPEDFLIYVIIICDGNISRCFLFC